MPTILKLLGFRFFFYSNEGTEPAHIHVEKGDCEAKFWLEPVELVYSDGFSAKEINQLRKITLEHQQQFKKAWHEYFG